jgi:reactive intermediate/imine deaminase
MTLKESVLTTKAPAPMPFFSQAIKCNGMVYCSGSIGMEPTSMKLVEGGVADRTVCCPSLSLIIPAILSPSIPRSPRGWTDSTCFKNPCILLTQRLPTIGHRQNKITGVFGHGVLTQTQKQALTNLSEVLKAAGSGIENVVKVNIFLTNMENFAAMNKVYDTFFSKEPKPCRTCVAVHQLPLGTDVEIELTAHL